MQLKKEGVMVWILENKRQLKSYFVSVEFGVGFNYSTKIETARRFESKEAARQYNKINLRDRCRAKAYKL